VQEAEAAAASKAAGRTSALSGALSGALSEDLSEDSMLCTDRSQREGGGDEAYRSHAASATSALGHAAGEMCR